MTTIIKRNKNLIPIILLGGLCLYTCYEILFVEVEYDGTLYFRKFSITNAIAFLLVLTNLSVYFLARKYFKYSVFATIILGFVGLMNYTPDKVVVNFIIPFEPVSLIVGFAYLILNFKRLKTKIPDNRKVNLSNAPDYEKVEEFKFKYRNKTLEELELLVNDKRFVVEAKIAAKDLLEEQNK